MASEKKVLRDKISNIVDSLLDENRDYFEDIREYMLFKSFLKDEKAILEQIYGMASDLKMAEADGLTAADFFGTDAKGMADQLLENAPRVRFKELASIYLSVVLVLFGIELLVLFSRTGHFQLGLYLFLGTCFNALVICWMIFVLLPKVLLKDNPSKWLIGLIFIGGIILVNVTFNLPTMVANKGIYLSFPEFVDWLFVVVVGLATLLMAIKEKAFRAMSSLIFVSLINGVLKKLVAIGVVSGQLWSVGLPITSLVFGLLLFYLNSYRLSKEADKR
ncbi:hypothetical protein GRB29_05125 [Streptococcus pneumoniae]|nr:hypothetical protein [Streptococcus pneumoniae]